MRSNIQQTASAARTTRLILLTLLMLFALPVSAATPVASISQVDIPMDQALVLAGGESTNPRSFDPPPMRPLISIFTPVQTT